MTEPRHTVHAAEDHAAEAPLPAALAIGGGGGERERGAAPHAGKFRTALGVLIGLAIAALVIAAALLVRPSDSGPSFKWSTWHPLSDGLAGAREIADHIAPLYRISGVDQLAVVTVANVSSSNAGAGSSSGGGTPSSSLQVAVRPDATKSGVSLLSGNTIAYNLCGIGGADCSITVGTPSTDRQLLLRREALELALYTFKYISGTENVVALLPPGHPVASSSSTLTPKPPSTTTQPATSTTTVHEAVLFLHDELQPFLDQPLSATLPLAYPPTVDELKLWRQTQEAALVEQVTAHGMFLDSVSQAQDGSNLLVLNPVPPS